MIIRSQDKKIIVNFNGIDTIDVRDEQVRYFANGGVETMGLLGKYSTQEKAFKVLDMICEEYKKYTSAKSMSTYFAFIPPKVFQMPSDESVEV